jgi:hypothetical protein
VAFAFGCVAVRWLPQLREDPTPQQETARIGLAVVPVSSTGRTVLDVMVYGLAVWGRELQKDVGFPKTCAPQRFRYTTNRYGRFVGAGRDLLVRPGFWHRSSNSND